jgi:hypothetical protein
MIPPAKKYLDKHLNYLRKIVPGTPYKIVAEKFNKKFGLKLSVDVVKGIAARSGVRNGRDTRFKPGHVSFNKGKKGVYYAGCEKGWFKKGNKLHTTLPIGSERVTVNGYVEVKYSNRSGSSKNRWKSKHSMIWEKEHGPVPKGYVVIFLDSNKRNFALNNLQLISRAELYVMNHHGLISEKKDMTKAGHALAAVKIAIASRKRESFKKVKGRKMFFRDNNGSKIYVAHGEGRHRNKWVAVRETANGPRRLRASLKARASFYEAQRDLYEYALFRGWQRV